MEVTVKLNNLRRSPGKIRPVLHIIRGKNASRALDILRFTEKGVALELYKLVKSGIAAAHEREMKEENLIVKVAKCDGAGMYKRHRYGARGRVVRIVKRNSHLTVTLSDEIVAKETKKDVIKKEITTPPETMTDTKPKAKKKEIKDKGKNSK